MRIMAKEKEIILYTNLLLQPCNFLDQLFKAFLKCVGHDHHQNDDPHGSPTSTSQNAQGDAVSPAEMKNDVSLFPGHLINTKKTHPTQILYTHTHTHTLCF